jgi:hypothetical protein
MTCRSTEPGVRRHERLLEGLDKKLIYSIIDALQQRAEALLRDPKG